MATVIGIPGNYQHEPWMVAGTPGLCHAPYHDQSIACRYQVQSAQLAYPEKRWAEPHTSMAGGRGYVESADHQQGAVPWGDAWQSKILQTLDREPQRWQNRQCCTPSGNSGWPPGLHGTCIWSKTDIDSCWDNKGFVIIMENASIIITQQSCHFLPRIKDYHKLNLWYVILTLCLVHSRRMKSWAGRLPWRWRCTCRQGGQRAGSSAPQSHRPWWTYSQHRPGPPTTGDTTLHAQHLLPAEGKTENKVINLSSEKNYWSWLFQFYTVNFVCKILC